MHRQGVTEVKRKFMDGPAETIVPGVTAIKAGGHFDGSLVLHWEKKLFIADTLMVTRECLFLILPTSVFFPTPTNSSPV